MPSIASAKPANIAHAASDMALARRARRAADMLGRGPAARHIGQ
jgi:hypothetical protein